MLRWLRVCTAVWCCAIVAACDNTTAEQYTASAKDRLSNGDVATAVIELKNALQKDADYPEAHALMGEADARLGNYSGSMREYQSALDLGVDQDPVRLGLLRAKVRLGSYQEVIGALEGKGALAPPFAVVLAEAYLRAGDVQRAAALYAQGKSLSDGNLGLGMIAWQQGDPKQAERYLAEAVTLDPDNWPAWVQRGQLALSQGATKDAQAAFSKAAGFTGASVAAHAGLAQTDLQTGDTAAAATEVQTLKKMAPNVPMTHYLDGLVHLAQQDLPGAEAALRRVRRMAPDNDSSLYLMGIIQYRQRHLAEAEQSLQRYLERFPGNTSAAKLLAATRFDRGDYQGVADALDPYLAGSSDPQLYAMHGTAELRLGHPADAVRSLERAVELAPDMAPFHNQLALSLLASGDKSGAEAQLESAIGVDGKQFKSDYLLAMVRIKDRDWPAAAESVEALVSKNPDSPIGYNLRGMVALGRGDRDAARAAFVRAQAADASFLPAVRNLAALDEEDGHRDQAAARYQAFLKAHPGTEGALVALADLSVREGDSAAATGYLEQSVKDNPDSVRSRLGLARLYLAAGRLADARRVVTEARKRAPDLPDLLLLQGEIELRRGDEAAARDVAGLLQSRVTPATNPRLLLALGQLQARAGATTLARENLQQALRGGDGKQPAALQLLARLDLSDHKLDEAASRLHELEGVAAADPATRLLKADLLLARNERDDARRLYADLAAEGVREAVMRLANLDVANGDGDAAVHRLDAWLEKHPEDVGAQLVCAEALMGPHPDQAIARYEALLDTGNPVALNNLAWLYMQRQDPRAVKVARRAAEAAPDSAEILDTLGWVILQAKGDPAEAVKALRRSTQITPGNPTVQYHLGVALRDTGDIAGARQAFSTALEAGRFPEADAARAALAAL